MAQMRISVCILCASLIVVASVPLSLPGNKRMGESPRLPSKFRLPMQSSNNFKRDMDIGDSHPATKKLLADMTESSDRDSTEDNERLMSITDDMLQNDAFSVNDTVDYDSMSVQEPERLVPVEDETMSPSSMIENLSFQEVHERAKFIRIKEVKESILSKLRLLAPPNITALKMSNQLKRYPDHIIPKLDEPDDLQKDDNRSPIDDFHAKISTVIQFASDLPSDKHPELYPTHSIVYFSLPLTVSEKNVQKATLLIYIATSPGQEGRKVQLCISDTLVSDKPFVNRTVVLTARGHWEHVDISQLIIDWAADDTKNYGLIVSANLDEQNIAYLNDDPLVIEKEKIFLDGDITARPHRTPLVKIILNEEQGRYKRSFDEVPLSCDIKDRDQRCCRYKFIIDFQKLGPDFDFIIQPRRYLANYCAGTCPTYYLPTDGNSKLMMGFPKPRLQRCCTAMTKKPLSVLYYDKKGSMMLGEIPDMSIEKCYCS